MIRRLDAWLGRTLFHPPIILVCQLAGITQHALYRYVWCGIGLYAVSTDDHRSWLVTALLLLGALCFIVRAAVWPDAHTRPSFSFRLLLWALVAIGCAHAAAGGSVDGAVTNLAALFAEYATTIRTIPPREVGEKRRETAKAGV